MKNVRRLMSLIAAAAMCLALLPAMTATVSANATVDLYKPILKSFYRSFNAGGLKNSFVYGNYTANDVGYALVDLDQSGIPELLIGVMYSGTTGITNIDDLYTISGGSVSHVFSSGEWDTYYLAAGNKIMHNCSNGFSGIADSVTHLSGMRLVVDSRVSSKRVWDDSSQRYIDRYYYSSGVHLDDVAHSYDYGTSISQAKATSLKNAFPAKRSYNVTPIAKYDSLGPLPYLTQSELSFDYTGVFDFQYYINTYPDIKAAYGSNPTGALKHFLLSGMKEGRVASPVFSIQYYMSNYPDLKRVFGYDYVRYAQHFVKNGMKEMRQGNATFDVYFYRYYYSDLKKVYGTNWKNYYVHYIRHGYAEGRYSYVDPAKYKAVFNMDYYIEKNPDVYRVFGNNQKKLWVHFLKNGLKEGRTASPAFSIRYYQNYADLKTTFGTHYKRYIDHFIGSGVKEGRQSSLDFSVKVYRENNADLQAAYGDDMIKYAEHFANGGYKEDRIAV
ncbi:MAG: hypothetical protein IJU16_06775 [Clostridia bacterium]|nr:hypothetical protein [Clostridia bacterium]